MTSSDKKNIPLHNQSIQPEQVHKVYFPNLNGLRFIAFFAVFLHHSFYTPYPEIKNSILYKNIFEITRAGDLGVNFFFALSGFLITYLLLTEQAATGRIALCAFYMRRILRIWPLYFAMVLLGFVILPIIQLHFGEHAPYETARPMLYMLFLGNFSTIYYGYQTPTLAILWSVCVEEQFYLVWPLLMTVVPNRRLGWLFSSIVVSSLLFRVYYQADPYLLKFHTFSVIGDMAMGGSTAWLCFRNNRLITTIKSLSKWIIIGVYAGGMCLIVSRHLFLLMPSYIIFDRLLLALFFCFVLLEQNYADNSFFKMNKFRLLSYWGNYTYGLYCLHFLALLIAFQLLHRIGLNRTVLGVLLGDTIVGLAVALLLSWLSFTIYEKPFLKLKNRFAFIKNH